MNSTPPFDKTATEKAWEYYIRDGHELPDKIDGVRPEIVGSWKRSLGSRKICRSVLPKLSGKKLDAVLKENSLLVKIAYPYLLDFYQWIDDPHLQITLSDKHGYQLGRISKDDIDAPAVPDSSVIRKYQLDDGTDFSEATAGTNGIGTSLAVQQPVMIFGAEHFQAQYHDIACYAAPIYDPAGGLLGSINITGPLSDWDPLIMCVLKTAISGIQKEFELTRNNHILDTLIESCGQGVIMLDPDENILYCNTEAASLFHAEGSAIAGQPIDSLIDTGRLPEAVRHFDIALTDEDCTLYSSDGHALDLNLTIRPAGQNYHGMDCILILLRSQKYVHQLTTKLAGFSASCSFDSLVGTSSAMQIVTSLGKLAAEQTVPVLLLGEKGTGKQLLAQAIHNEGQNAAAPFVELNCASTPAAQLDSELFGNQNAETGVSIPGRIQLAEGGTLYLDEVSALPESLQKKLVKILQDTDDPERSSSHFRLIASSSENLLSLIRRGVFREDLYYRLNALAITIPPLRERREDISVSAGYFAQEITGHPVSLSEEAEAALGSWSWPGNTRELEETIRLSIHSAAQDEITISDLPVQISNLYYAKLMDQGQHVPESEELVGSSVKNAPEERRISSSSDQSDASAFSAKEYYRLTQALKSSGGNVQEAAKLLGMPASSMYRKLRKLNIRAKEYRR
jgi:transcriptional regulator of acetoin/glycerol metabolism